MFQSHLGSIQTIPNFKQMCQKNLFQSHLGSIQTRPFGGSPQPQRVSIPPWFDSNFPCSAIQLAEMDCFNPTLVRFKPGFNVIRISRPIGFQSHLGSIQTWVLLVLYYNLPLFQSHLGSIQTKIGSATFRLSGGFNPTLVRFKHNWLS